MEEIIFSRRVDDIGRVVLPIEFRKALRVSSGDEMDMELQKDSIILKNFRAHEPKESENISE